MKDLFDLPFEEEEEPRASSADARSERTPEAAVEQQPVQKREHGSPGKLEEPAGRPPAPAAAHRILTVSELTVRVRDHLEAEFFEVWVEGELSNCRPWNGHLYFTLKDAASQVRAFMFRSALRYLKFKPADGVRVVARGRISVYEPRGEYQLVAEHLEPHGLGALQLAFDQLKKRLHAEGLFDAARKRPLPALPRRIGVVTSLDGAAIHDIINVLRRRHANVQLVIRPVRVQGEGSAVDIARGLRAVTRVPGVDVVIVGRGGGSMEDLWAFNEELVARAIVLSPVPVISAVGHESDVTIADFVADVRAPTPSAAAEIVVAAKDEFCARIDRLRAQLRGAMRGRVQALSRQVHVVSGRPALAGFRARLAMRGRVAADLSHALARVARAHVARRERHLRHLRRQLDTFDIGRRLGSIRTRLVTADGRLGGAVAKRHHAAEAQLAACAGRLTSLSPLAVLGRGYAVCWNADRTRVLRDAEAAAPGEQVRVTLARGELECEVRGTGQPSGPVGAVSAPTDRGTREPDEGTR